MKERFYYIYYAILVVILVSWTSTTSFPPVVLRLAFGAAVVIPALYDKNGLLPAVLTCFWALTSNGYAYSYMPTSEYFYAAIMILATLLYGRRNGKINLPRFYLWGIFFIYALFVNFVTDQSVKNSSYVVLVILLFVYFIGDDLKTVIDNFSLAFLVLTIVISYYAVTMKDNIVLAQFMDKERTSWVDPNYMGMQVGMGTAIAVINVFKFSKLDTLQKFLSPIAIIISLPAILLTGSRGALLCIVGSMLVMLFSTKIKITYKILITLLVVMFVSYLLSEGYFELLFNRIENDDGTGSGRTEIWLHKLGVFATLNPLAWLFGVGLKGASTLGSAQVVGFHNDYIAILCSYGMIGLVLMLAILFAPIKFMNKQSDSRFEIYACIVYSVLAYLTLEPLSIGIVAFYVFMFYTLIKAKYSWNEEL